MNRSILLFFFVKKYFIELKRARAQRLAQKRVHYRKLKTRSKFGQSVCFTILRWWDENKRTEMRDD